MRFDIVHHTEFVYDAPVRESYNEVRACPVNDERQQVIAYRLTTSPASRTSFHVDYWGTRVDTFGVREPHTVLDVVAEATVITSEAPVGAPPVVAFETLDDEDFRDEHLDHVHLSPHTRGGALLDATVRRVGGADVAARVREISDIVHGALTYTSGATHVGIDLDEVISAGRGVCQDYAHLAVALCRRLGIPARYVSGYLFAADDATGADTTEAVVEVETHAWFEAAVPGWGWLALDPTNGLEVGPRHIKVGHGRDYDDVAPLRGVHSGGAASTVEAGVEIRRSAREFVPQGLRRRDDGLSRRLQQRQTAQQQQ